MEVTPAREIQGQIERSRKSAVARAQSLEKPVFLQKIGHPSSSES